MTVGSRARTLRVQVQRQDADRGAPRQPQRRRGCSRTSPTTRSGPTSASAARSSRTTAATCAWTSRKAIQGQAWDQLVHEQAMWRTGVDEETLRKVMSEYPHGGDPYGVDRPMSPAYEIAAAKTLGEV